MKTINPRDMTDEQFSRLMKDLMKHTPKQQEQKQ